MIKHYDIVQAGIEDLPSIMETFIACTSEMKKSGIDQWDYQYPEPTRVLEDIRRGEVFIVKNEKRCLATVTLNTHQDKQYEKIEWKYNGSEPMVMHRLAVHPVAQGEGLGRIICRFCEDYALQQGCESIRLDAYSKNPASIGLYKSLDYEQAQGLCYFHGNSAPFHCYEKKLGRERNF